MSRHMLVALTLAACIGGVRADGPKDNMPDNVRRIPPLGITLPAELQQELTEGVETLGKEIDALRTALTIQPLRAC